MKKVSFTVLLLLLLASGISAQKIAYGFGKQSDVIDSVKSVIERYKKEEKEADVRKLRLFAMVDMADGKIHVLIGQYNKNDKALYALAHKSNRVIRVDTSCNLPLLFNTDVLSDELRGEVAYMNLGGYSIEMAKNEKNIWKVTEVRMNF